MNRTEVAKKQALEFAASGSTITEIQETFCSPVYSVFDVTVYRELVDGSAKLEVRVMEGGYTSCRKISGHPRI